MAGGKSCIWIGGGWNHVAKVRKIAVAVHVAGHGLRMGISRRIRMLDGATKRIGLHHHPLLIALFQRIGDPHGRAGWRPGFGHEFSLGLGGIAIYGDVGDVHVHGAEIQSFQRAKVLLDAFTDAVVDGGRLVAANRGKKRSG